MIKLFCDRCQNQLPADPPDLRIVGPNYWANILIEDRASGFETMMLLCNGCISDVKAFISAGV